MYFEKAQSALSLQANGDSDIVMQLKLLYSQLYEVNHLLKAVTSFIWK